MNRQEAEDLLPEVVRQVGILDTYKATLDLLATKKNPEAASVMAHKVFLSAMKTWYGDNNGR